MRFNKPTRIPKIKLGSATLDVMQIFRIGARMSELRKGVASDAAAASALDGVIEMVEVAPQTFAPAPAQRRPSAHYPLAAAFDELSRESKKR